jgi:hypothetical protein
MKKYANINENLLLVVDVVVLEVADALRKRLSYFDKT